MCYNDNISNHGGYMPYKIAHFADTHIRNLKYHEEYRFVFKQMYQNVFKKLKKGGGGWGKMS